MSKNALELEFSSKFGQNVSSTIRVHALDSQRKSNIQNKKLKDKNWSIQAVSKNLSWNNSL